MRVYVNVMANVALDIPRLEGNTNSGTLAFDGQVVISNLIVKENVVERFMPEEGIDPVAHDSRYLRKWQVSEPITTSKGIDFSEECAPSDEMAWEEIEAERRGLINLTRKFGKTEGRRIAWLKTTIYSEKQQNKTLCLGFSDKVWVINNGSLIHVDKNLYGSPMQKVPDGRCSIENINLPLPLREGENQLMLGVSNFFYDWGIVARFNDLEEIELEH